MDESEITKGLKHASGNPSFRNAPGSIKNLRTFNDSPQLLRTTVLESREEFSGFQGSHSPQNSTCEVPRYPSQMVDHAHATETSNVTGLRTNTATRHTSIPEQLPPAYDMANCPKVEVSHYPILQRPAVASKTAQANFQNVPYILQNPYEPVTANQTKPANSGCQCSCHHTHHHHHHHTIYINGQSTGEHTSGSMCRSIPNIRIPGSPRLGVLKTASCPAWADGAPKADRPIRNYNTNNNTICEGASMEGEVYFTPGCNNSNNNGDQHKRQDIEMQSTPCRYQGPVTQENKPCWKLSLGMTILLIVLIVVIISLLSGLIFFLARGNPPNTDSSNKDDTSSKVPQVSVVINQTTVCGVFPAEYLPITTRTLTFKRPPVNVYPPENDSRINKSQAARIIGGVPANILQYPWQDSPSDRPGFRPITDDMIPDEIVDASMVKGRIFGGRDSTVMRFPWQVRLHAVSLYVDGRGMTCGGSIILKNWVLTAAHCTYSNNEPELWTAYMGMSVVSKRTKPPAQNSKIVQIIQHAKYVDDWSYDYDVSLMQLETPVTFTPSVQPICLPSATDEFKDGTGCWISGWGSMTDSGQGGSPTILQSAQVDIIGYSTCRRDDWLGELVTDRMMCAGKADGSRDACQGDSGGPLSCYDSERKVWTLAGSVSWGIDCGVKQQPGVYAKIPFFVNWIWTKIGVAEGWIEEIKPIESENLNEPTANVSVTTSE